MSCRQSRLIFCDHGWSKTVRLKTETCQKAHPDWEVRRRPQVFIFDLPPTLRVARSHYLLVSAHWYKCQTTPLSYDWLIARTIVSTMISFNIIHHLLQGSSTTASYELRLSAERLICAFANMGTSSNLRKELCETMGVPCHPRGQN